MALKPEFIGLMREIRDTMYPRIVQIDAEIEIESASIKEMYDEIVVMDERVVSINTSIKTITMGTVTTVPNNPDGSAGNAAARYNATLNKFEFDIPRGAKGETGAEGADGTQGIQGIQGLKGDTGNIGLTGPQGSTGATGITGLQGVSGVKGDTGDQGPSGIGIDIQGTDTLANIKLLSPTTVGESWLTSTSGLDDDGLAVDVNDVMRATGTKWITVGPIEGPAGPAGQDGATGPQGLTGEAGIQGIQGVEGPTGPKGDAGDTGTQGIQGIQGVQGIQGPVGDTGVTGAQGESYIIRGTDTVSNITSAGRLAGDLWIASDSGLVGGNTAVAGDGIYWDGIIDTIVGQIRGPEGIVNFASQVEVDAGTVDDKGVTPETLANSSLIASKLPLAGGTVTGQIKGVVPQDAADLTRMDWVQSRIAEGINTIMPIGGIINYHGAFANIPAGWALCDGDNGTPNLVDRFIRGTVTELDVGNTGGTEAASMPSHTHTAPSHTHSANHNHTASTASSGSHTHPRKNGLHQNSDFYDASTAYGNNGTYTASTSGRSAGSHTHTVTVSTKTMNTGSGGGTATSAASAAGDNKPPYYTLAYIMRVS